MKFRLVNKPPRSFIFMMLFIGIIIIGGIGFGTIYSMLGSVALTAKPGVEQFTQIAKITKITKSEPKTLAGSPTDEQPVEQTSNTPAPAAAPKPQSSAPATKQKADPKADCQQRIAKLRVTYDAKAKELMARQEAALADLKQNYERNMASNVPGTSYEAYQQEMNAVYKMTMQLNQAAYAEFSAQIKAIGCWF